jgi:2'-5' RNA ligase
MRLFTAVTFPEETRKHLVGVLDTLRALPALKGLVRWSNQENLHVTLKFIGEVPDQRVPLLVTSLKTLSIPAMSFTIDRFLILPGQGPARVLAANVTRDLAPISLLFNQIEAACQPLGVSRERREYKPHVTFGRFSRPGPKMTARTLIRMIDPGLLPAPSFISTGFTLFQSELRPEGAVHAIIAEFSGSSANRCE